MEQNALRCCNGDTKNVSHPSSNQEREGSEEGRKGGREGMKGGEKRKARFFFFLLI